MLVEDKGTWSCGELDAEKILGFSQVADVKMMMQKGLDILDAHTITSGDDHVINVDGKNDTFG